MAREDIIAQIPTPDKVFLFRSCVASNKYPGMELASVEVLRILGVEPVTSDDQGCCGGFLTFTNVAEPTSTMPVVARNLSLAEEMGLDTVVMCNGCYTFLSEFSEFMNERPPVKDMINMMLDMTGHHYNGVSNVYHIAEIIYKLKDRVKANIKRPLTGLRIATHYGCHYLNGYKNTAIDDAFMPTFMEELIEIMGGEVAHYYDERACCGTGLTQIIIHKEDIALPHTQAKLDSIKEARPDMVVVICPYCLSQLDRMQAKLTDRGIGDYNTPVLSLSQLVGMALGVPLEKLGFDAHAISFKPVLDKWERGEVHV